MSMSEATTPASEVTEAPATEPAAPEPAATEAAAPEPAATEAAAPEPAATEAAAPEPAATEAAAPEPAATEPAAPEPAATEAAALSPQRRKPLIPEARTPKRGTQSLRQIRSRPSKPRPLSRGFLFCLRACHDRCKLVNEQQLSELNSSSWPLRALSEQALL
jgi:hypothetical protein